MSRAWFLLGSIHSSQDCILLGDIVSKDYNISQHPHVL
jgi:hypothetical protein